MQDYVVVIVASVAGIISLALLLVLCFCLLRTQGAFEKRRPERATSRIYPRISSPIYAISNNSIDKKPTRAGDTLRKLPMFDRKRAAAFSSKSLYYDHDASPRVAHKEYLDFNAIESMIPPASSRPPARSQPVVTTESYYEEHHNVYRNQRRGQESEDQGSFDSEETSSTHVSKESLEEQPSTSHHQAPPLRGRISVIDERPFSGSPPTTHQHFEPVREIYRENHVSYDRD